MTQHHHGNDPFNAARADGVSHDSDTATHDSRAVCSVPTEILELLQRQAEQLLRTHRESHRTTTDAPIVDPLALAGSGSTAGAAPGNADLDGTLQKLLALGGKLLAKLESPSNNPFNFLP
ncbi:MAG: hypothetical protein ACP5I8_04980 [Phycisphaerae bacterium]